MDLPGRECIHQLEISGIGMTAIGEVLDLFFDGHIFEFAGVEDIAAF